MDEVENNTAHGLFTSNQTTANLKILGLISGQDSMIRRQNTMICMLAAMANDRPIPRTCGLGR